MKVQNLNDLYVHQLKDLYSAESQLIEALPKMVDAASDKELKEAFQNHLQQTRQHKEKVQSLLQELESNPTSTKCKGMEGLIEEGSEAIKMEGDQAARDAALIAAAQRVEHYEIAGYGTVRSYAQELGYKESANTLEAILKQESETDELLTRLATGGILRKGVNAQAQR
ncbi:MAG: ferritin-like domain-containing protein [Chloroflexota bacterium]